MFFHRRQPSPLIKRAAKKELPPASRSSSRDTKKKAVAPAPSPKGAGAASTAARSKSGSVAAQKASAAAPKRKTPTPKAAGGGSASGLAAQVACPAPPTVEGGDGGQAMASQGGEGKEEGEKDTAVKQTKVSRFVRALEI